MKKLSKFFSAGFALFMLLAFTACSNATVEAGGNGGSGGSGGGYTPKYAVGDIILKSGDKVAYNDAKNYTDTDLTNLQSDTIAVIFKSDTETTKALGVGLKIGQHAWCSTDAEAKGIDIEYIRCKVGKSNGKYSFSLDCDGSDNLEQIGQYLTDNSITDDTSVATKYPAFYYAKQYGTNNSFPSSFQTGWYLPTEAELFLALEQVTTIDAVSTLCGGNKFEDTNFISSSQAYDSGWGDDEVSCCSLKISGGSLNWSLYDKDYANSNVFAIRAFD